MKNAVLCLFALAFTQFAFAQAPSPLILKTGEEILFKGTSFDQVRCDKKIFDEQNFSIVVTSNPKKCDCDADKVKRIYIDGLLEDSCKKDIEYIVSDKYKDSFIDLAFIDKLSDKELSVLANNSAIGTCRFQGSDLDSSKPVRKLFDSYKAEAKIRMNADDRDSQEVVVQSYRDFIKDGLCGDISASVLKKHLASSRRILGRLNLGLSVFVKEGFSSSEILRMQYPVDRMLKMFNPTVEEFVGAGYGPRSLVDGGISISDLKKSFTLSDMLQDYVSTSKLKDEFSVKDFQDAGYKASNLKSVGFTSKQLKAADISLSDLLNAYYPSSELKELFSIKDFQAAGYKASNLKSIGYSSAELKAAGVSLSDLLNAYYSSSELKNLFTVSDFQNAGYKASNLKSIGYTAQELKTAGISLSDLLNAYYSSSELKNLFSVKDFQQAGYKASNLKSIGYTASELKASNVSLSDMLNAYYSASDLKALFKVSDFQNAGYKASNLRSIGYSASELKEAGVPLSDMVNAYYSSSDLKVLFSASDFKAIGYSATNLRSLGYSAKEARAAGFPLSAIVNAGFSSSEIDNL